MKRENISKMKKPEIINRISLIYGQKKEGMTCFEKKLLEELQPLDIERLNQFHTQKVIMVTKDEDYYVGIRADHFVVEVGFIEAKDNVFYLVTANHKGYKAMTLISDTKNKIER